MKLYLYGNSFVSFVCFFESEEITKLEYFFYDLVIY